MATSKAWTNYPLVFDTETGQAGSAIYVQGVTTLSPGLASGMEMSAGDVYNTIAFLQSGAPVANLSSPDLKEFLDVCGTTGLLVDSGVSGDGMVMYFQKYAAGGTRVAAATAQHWSCTIGDGIVVPRTLAMSNQGTANLTADVIAISSDGSTSPLTYSETATLPTGIYPALDAIWTLGKVDLNSTQIQGVSNITIDFGINIITENGDSDIYPTQVAIQVVQPSITISTRHIDATATLTEAGLEYAASTVKVYARKRDEGGTFVVNGTQEHISFTMGKCRVEPTNISGEDMSFTITPWYTAGGSPVYPIVIDTTAAIA